jgi:uncharacterized membrane protein HdeD (DUF308 family)
LIILKIDKESFFMKVINGIVGVLSIFGAIYCLFFPGLSFINIGWVITTILGIFGICSIIFYFTKKKMYENLMIEGVHGAFGLVVGIAAAVVSMLAIFVPSIQAVLDLIILIIFAIWMILDGVSSIAESFAMKKASTSKSWILALVLGIIMLIFGIYGICHLIFVARFIGITMGIMLMSYGIKLIASLFEKDEYCKK